ARAAEPDSAATLRRAAAARPARGSRHERQAATRRRAVCSRTAAWISASAPRARLPPGVRWSTVTTTSSTYTDVFFPQVVFTGKLIGEHEQAARGHEQRPGR